MNDLLRFVNSDGFEDVFLDEEIKAKLRGTLNGTRILFLSWSPYFLMNL